MSEVYLGSPKNARSPHKMLKNNVGQRRHIVLALLTFLFSQDCHSPVERYAIQQLVEIIIQQLVEIITTEIGGQWPELQERLFLRFFFYKNRVFG